jgi:hypothetical protein
MQANPRHWSTKLWHLLAEGGGLSVAKPTHGPSYNGSKASNTRIKEPMCTPMMLQALPVMLVHVAAGTYGQYSCGWYVAN